MSHFAFQRFTTAGLKYSRKLSAFPIKPYSRGCVGAIAPLNSYFTSCQRSFMNKIDTSSKPFSGNPNEIIKECSRLYDSLSGLNEKLGGTAIPKSSPHTSLPFCLLVGNHSSGKSSFINYILKRDIQKAGVAPTDDTFTVITPGPVDTGTCIFHSVVPLSS